MAVGFSFVSSLGAFTTRRFKEKLEGGKRFVVDAETDPGCGLLCFPPFPPPGHLERVRQGLSPL